MEELKRLIRSGIGWMVPCYLADKLTLQITEYLYANGVRVPQQENSMEVE